MTAVFDFLEGNAPLLVSIPHDGRKLAPGLKARMNEAGRALPDTDWHVRRLYEFAGELGASVISAEYSRYVVDLNRPADDAELYPGQLSTGLCPEQTFAGQDIYFTGSGVDDSERRARVTTYWQPYHDRIANTLGQLRDEFGYALLWDAHSIAGEVPSLFDGSLPDLNVGTNDGASCGEEIVRNVMQVCEASGYSAVLNGRFKGGHITRNYGCPEQRVHAIQLEIAQRAYMDEGSLRYDEARAAKLVETIRAMLHAFLAAAKEQA